MTTIQLTLPLADYGRLAQLAALSGMELTRYVRQTADRAAAAPAPVVSPAILALAPRPCEVAGLLPQPA